MLAARGASAIAFAQMFKKRYSRPGSPPATLVSPPAAAKPVMRFVEYDANSAVEHVATSVDDLPAPTDDGKVRWVEVNGLGDVEVLRALGVKYGIHPLALEDVLNLGQRPKIEAYERHLFIIAQMLYHDEEYCLCGEQVSLFVGPNLLISIQEDSKKDVFDPVRERIRSGGGNVRKSKADYLAYALLDAIMDHCFPVLEEIGESLEELEDSILSRHGAEDVGAIHNFKRTLVQLRRMVWPERDVVSSLLHSESTIIRPETKVFLRDLYDHTVQIIDLIENYRDLTTSLNEMHLSSVNLRTSEVMRVLTVMSSIFIPLTFLAGLYGMNFVNMPELRQPWGYFACLGLMATVALSLVLFFKRRNWL